MPYIVPGNPAKKGASMSELEKEMDAILEDGLNTLKQSEQIVRERLKRFVQMFKESAALVLPIDAVKVFEKGGLVIAKVVNIQDSGEAHLNISNKEMFEWNELPKLRRTGKFRVILILEPLDPPPSH